MADLHGPAGNVYDKFNTRNPFARWLMNGFKRSLFELIASLEVASLSSTIFTINPDGSLTTLP